MLTLLVALKFKSQMSIVWQVYGCSQFSPVRLTFCTSALSFGAWWPWRTCEGKAAKYSDGLFELTDNITITRISS